LLFAGTENAVWVSFDDGDHWQTLQLNLPHTSMRDLWIQENDLIVGTHGRSFWILDDIAPLRQLSESVATAKAHLFQPAVAYRIRRDTNTDTPLPPDEPTGQNPPEGAIIDYALDGSASGPVTLEILDGKGKLVREYSSSDHPGLSSEQLQQQVIPTYWVRPVHTLATGDGMHRWAWDLRYSAPVSTHRDYPIAAVPHDTPRVPLGPLVLPGQYLVRLTAHGESYTAPLTVKMDPRVKTPAAGLERQFQLELRLAGMMNQVAGAVLEARSVREQLDRASKNAGGETAEAIKSLQRKLAAVMDPPEPGSATSAPALTTVNGVVNTLYEQIGLADAPPTTAQAAESAKIEKDVADVTERWNEFKNRDLPSLNQKLKGAGLQEVLPQGKNEAQQDEGDED